MLRPRPSSGAGRWGENRAAQCQLPASARRTLAMHASSRVTQVVLAALLPAVLCGTVQEPRTKISFKDKGLKRLGVRTKGPIKVYAVGEYLDAGYMVGGGSLGV